jgi:hypothetical protein
MDLNKKYFGMTVTQLGILGGLAGLAFLLFCITGFLILGRGLRGANAPAVALATDTPQPTVTPFLSPTPTSTPAATAVPYETLIPKDWVQYHKDLFELWLPAGYKSAKVDPLVIGLGGTPILDLSLQGKYTSKSPNKIFVTVSYEPMTSDNFDAFLNSRLESMGLNPSERSKVRLNATPAVRLVFSGRKGNNTDINELTYVVLDGTTVWYVQYTAEITEYFDLLETFEQSAKTFRMVK